MEVAKAGRLSQLLWPFQLAKKTKAIIILRLRNERTINIGNLVQPGTRCPPVLSHAAHSDRCSHICRDICTQLRACRFADTGMMLLQRGNKKEGGRAGVRGHQPGRDIVPVAPLAAPAPSVIRANICKPKVPLSPSVRAVCLAFPLRKPGVLLPNRIY